MKVADMKERRRTEFRTDSLDLVDFIISHLRWFIIAGIAAAVISAVISLLIRPMYESTVTLYPSSNIAGASTLLGDPASSAHFFGNDDATEKLIQVIRSEQVREYLKESYDLVSHYNIKPGERYPNTLLSKKLDKYLHCSKGPLGAVIIRVRDHDRDTASAMANDVAARADTIFNMMRRHAAMVMLGEIEQSLRAQEQLVRVYEDSLGKAAGGAVLRLYSTLEAESSNLALIRGKQIEALAMSRQTLPYTLVVDHAVPAEKKVTPRRLLIVMVSTISLLITLALVLFVAEGLRVHREGDETAPES